MSTNDAARANAPAMPEMNRRRLLIGLAAASTAAAATTVTVDAVAAPAENPKLLALAAELPAIAEAYHAARSAYDEMEKKWNAATPLAPDELTAPGTAWVQGGPKQPGETETPVLGGALWRKGEEFPRRIVVTSCGTGWPLHEAKRTLRKAKKAGCVADCLLAEDEIKRLKKLRATAQAYETEYEEVKAKAVADHKRLNPIKCDALEALEKHVASIMTEQDLTMEGLVIKAEALAGWNRVAHLDRITSAIRHGMNWHGQIAASILRHAKGGEA